MSADETIHNGIHDEPDEARRAQWAAEWHDGAPPVTPRDRSGVSDEDPRAGRTAPEPWALRGDRGEALTSPIAPVRWICRDLQLARGGRPMLLVAFGGSAKTWTALDVAQCTALRAKRCLGSLAIQEGGDVMWLNFEMARDEIRRRNQRLAWARKEPADCGGALEIVSRSHLGGVTLTDARMRPALVSALQGRALCVIDSFRAAVGGLDENSSEIRKPLDILLEVSDVTGCAFMVIHHETKPGDHPKSPIHRTRGSGAIVDASDTTWHLVPSEHATRIEQGKVSLAQKAQPFHVRLKDVGEIDPATGRHHGIEIEWMPSEQVAELAAEDPIPVRNARAAIRKAFSEHAELTKNAITRSAKYARGQADAKRKAFDALEAEGEIVKVGKGKGYRRA